MGGIFGTVTVRELVSFVLGAVGLTFFAYPSNYTYLVASLGGTPTQVSWLGLGLIALAIIIFAKRWRFLERAIT